MCFFKKNKNNSKTIDSKFKKGESILFRNHRGELLNGYIYEVYQDKSGAITYDVQVGGECPVVYRDVQENKIIKRK